jgi:hypothetical protein
MAGEGTKAQIMFTRVCEKRRPVTVSRVSTDPRLEPLTQKRIRSGARQPSAFLPMAAIRLKSRSELGSDESE